MTSCCSCCSTGGLSSSHLDRFVRITSAGVGGAPVAAHFCSTFKSLQLRDAKISGPGFLPRRKGRSAERRCLRLVLNAELSKSFSVNGIGLDSRANKSHDLSKLPWIGPLPGDIAEVEAFCRIFRAAERLHNSLMETLCNPLTGECSVTYDVPLEDKPLLEDKIVSVLGCMLCLLNKGREDVLSGRSSHLNIFRSADVDAMDDKLPPLAMFRGEMKRYCESLHVALENYLTPDDVRNLEVWKKLQRLKNVCYDSGFPRGEDSPCHTLFANWNPVYLSMSKEETKTSDDKVAFWSGSQLTEEGLNWLMDNGFRTIVDLRAENVKDNFYEQALQEAMLSGKLELVKLPVEVGTAPSREQVEKFASLVLDSGKGPIYLHSKEGMWRTSAMVSRWRQYMARNPSQFVSSQVVGPLDVLSSDSIRAEELNASPNFKEYKEESVVDDKGELLKNLAASDRPKAKGEGSLQVSSAKYKLESNGSYNDSASHQHAVEADNVDCKSISSSDFCSEVNPLKSQLPPSNIFSRKEMSEFLRSKNVTPPNYFSSYHQKMQEVYSSGANNTRKFLKPNGTFANPGPKLIEKGGMNGSIRSIDVPSYNQVNYKTYTSNISVDPNLEKVTGRKGFDMHKIDDLTSTHNQLGEQRSRIIHPLKKGNDETSVYLVDDELGMIEGNMCASTTGVVRLQSRKKAEMFLVRTDGFSCSRERVTESSLAFTHPSTQQQMLLWKSKPKTVLLLKKLGRELMEEAKEVASFLYHKEKMNVLVEPELHDIFARIPGFGFVQTFYSQDTSDLHERVDFVACLGGDGVILHASNLFRGAVPPVVSFNLGSLGFLTSHAFEDYEQDLAQVIHGNKTLDGVYITLRMRLRCEIFRNGKAMPGKVFDVLNEIVVDRGSNPYLSKIECYEHDRLITKVQGDGVIIATPTGSTAYSTSAGGSMVHPNVPCMLFTPICPHSLSFRPVILPDSARLELKIPDDARSNAWVSFDGKRRQQLSRGDSVQIYMSEHPLPTVNKSDQTGDWFHSLVRCLNWNERLDQKAL